MLPSRWLMFLMVGLPLAWIGCGGGDHGLPSESASPMAATRAPVVPDSDGNVGVFIGFSAPAGPPEQALVRGLGGKVRYTYQLVPAMAATLPEAAVEALQRNPQVEYVEGILECHEHNPDWQELPWGVDHIDAEVVWGGGEGTKHIAGGPTGSEVRVAVIDSGIDYLHEDLDDNYVIGGYDYVNEDSDPMDDRGHGSHVAGTIAGEDQTEENEGMGLGVIGVAPEAQLYALKVLNAAGSGTFDDIIAALEWCAGDETTGRRVDIANMSLGSDQDPGTTVRNACDNAYAAGVFLVASAGNNGKRSGRGDNIGYPAAYNSVSAVGATTHNDSRATFSSTGLALELMGPGYYIYSTYLREAGDPIGYATKSGTSMASPHVAGVAALLLSIDPGLAPSQVRQILKDTAVDLGTSGFDTRFGWGRVNALAAAQSVQPSDLPPTISITDPTEGSTISGSITLTADASDDQGVNQVEFFVDGSSVGIANDGPDGWSTSWESTTVADGEQTLSATATDTSNQTTTDTVTVTVDNNDDPPTVSIIDPVEGSTVSGTTVTIQIDATDDRDAVENLTVEYAIDNGTWQPTSYNSSSGYYEATWDSTTVGDGGHILSATATDTSPQPATDEVAVSVNNSGPTSLHVGDLDGTSVNHGSTWEAQVTITVHGDDESLVEGATVWGSWDNGPSADAPPTNSSGQATMTLSAIPKRQGSVAFQVVDVDHLPLGYDSGQNHETTITVSKP